MITRDCQTFLIYAYSTFQYLQPTVIGESLIVREIEMGSLLICRKGPGSPPSFDGQTQKQQVSPFLYNNYIAQAFTYRPAFINFPGFCDETLND